MNKSQGLFLLILLVLTTSVFGASWSRPDQSIFYINQTIYTLNGTGFNLSQFNNDVDFINSSYANATYILQSEEPNLNVNSSLYSNSTTWWAGVFDFASDWFSNVAGYLVFNEAKMNTTIEDIASNLDLAINATANTKALPGNCAAGYVVQNTTTGGVECVLNNEPTLTFYPNTTYVLYGTNTTGNITLMAYYDDLTYNISEAAGVNAMEVYINFTGVTDLNGIIMRERYAGGLGHEIFLEIYDYIGADWESYFVITDQSSLVQSPIIPIIDPTDHLSGGLVQIRFRHSQPGNNNHRLYIDYINVIKGTTTISNIEHDSLSSRDEADNHPQYLMIDGTRNMTGNLPMNNYNITALNTIYFNNNATTNKIYDNSSCTILTGSTSTINIC